MSLLEDRITKIIELRVSNVSDAEIAERMQTSVAAVHLYEESAKTAIETVINSGTQNISEVCNVVGLSFTSLVMFSSYKHIQIPGIGILQAQDSSPQAQPAHVPKAGRYRPKVERYTQIKEARDMGAKTYKEIGEIVGLNAKTVRRYCYEIKICLEMGRKAEKIKVIERMIKSGVRDYEEISRVTGLKVTTIQDYRHLAKIQPGIRMGMRRSRIAKHREDMDELIALGISMIQIGKKVGVSREGVRQYINRTGQYPVYRELRETQTVQHNAKQRKAELKLLVAQLGCIVGQRLAEEPWPVQKTAEYMLVPKAQIYPRETLLRLFKAYESGNLTGINLSVDELAKKAGLKWASGVSRILKAVNLKTMCQESRKKRSTTTLEEKQAIQRASTTNLGSADSGYFLGLPGYVAAQRFINMGRRVNNAGTCLAYHPRGRGQPGVKPITYRLASQVYEATDADYSIKDISQLTGESEPVIKYVSSKRPEFGLRIIKALRVLYPDHDIKKPYIECRGG